jgi:hypothetical protein
MRNKENQTGILGDVPQTSTDTPDAPLAKVPVLGLGQRLPVLGLDKETPVLGNEGYTGNLPDLIMPNGKKMGDCTGDEIEKFGRLLERMGRGKLRREGGQRDE